MLECLSLEFRQGLEFHAQAPTSSTHRDAAFYLLLRRLDGIETTLLDDIPMGAQFTLDGRVFEKGKTRRTRCLCRAMANGADYQISRLAEVEYSPTPLKPSHEFEDSQRA